MTRKTKIIATVSALVILVAGTLLFFFLRSHNSHVQLRLIPKNAAGVVQVNVKDIALKADPAKLLQLPAFKKASGKSGDLGKIISDALSTGLDPVENVYAFVAKNHNDYDFGIVFKVSDAEKLATFVQGLSLGSRPQSDGNTWYVELDDRRCMAWTNDAGLLLATQGYDFSGTQTDVRSLAETFLHQDKDMSIASLKEFRDFTTKDFDIGLFFNNAALAAINNSNDNPFASLTSPDGYSDVLINFENDKISAVYNYHSDNTTTISVLKSTGPDPKAFEALAPKTPLAYAGLAVDVKGFFSLMNSNFQTKRTLLQAEMEMGLTEDEIKNLLTGDVTFAFTDYRDISQTDPQMKKRMDEMKELYANLGSSYLSHYSDYAPPSLASPLFTFSIGVTDEAKAKELIEKMRFEKYDTDIYSQPYTSVYCSVKNGHVLVSNDFDAVKSFAANGKMDGKLPDDIAKSAASCPFYTWMDFNQQHFPQAITNPSAGNYDMQMIAQGLAFVKPITSVTVQGKGQDSELDINIEKGDGNCLNRLITYYAGMMN